MDSRLWLSHAVNATLESGGTPIPKAHVEDRIEWMSAQNGFDNGQVTERINDELVAQLHIEFHEIHSMNLVMHKLHLAVSLLGVSNRRDAALELLACCAFVVGRIDDAQYCLGQRGDGDTISHDLISAIAKSLLRKDAPLDEHLTHHPMAHLRLWSDYRVFGQIALCIGAARDQPGGLPDPLEVYGYLGRAENRLRRALSMCIALSHADGVVDRSESTLLESLAKIARIEGPERAVVEREYTEPMGMNQLLEGRISWIERRYTYLSLYISAYINGRHHVHESQFIMDVAQIWGDDVGQIEVLESEALLYFDSHHELLMPGVSDGFLGLLRHSLQQRFESALKQNGRRLVTEIGETKDLLQLMGQAVRRPLTPEEEKRARSQLVDLMKTVPALAVFALPGGAFLLPMVIKYLRLELRPSSFKDDVELGASSDLDDT